MTCIAFVIIFLCFSVSMPDKTQVQRKQEDVDNKCDTIQSNYLMIIKYTLSAVVFYFFTNIYKASIFWFTTFLLGRMLLWQLFILHLRVMSKSSCKISSNVAFNNTTPVFFSVGTIRADHIYTDIDDCIYVN